MTTSPNDKTVVLVLGMHRSGTSAVAASLEQLGVVMGRSLLHGDKWNPKGYFEEKQIVEFNDNLLRVVGLRWDSVLPPSESAGVSWADKFHAARDLLSEIFADTPVWGFKDPRMCILSSFWLPVMKSIDVAPRLLLVLRSPVEVASSLFRRDGISIARAGWLWFIYLLGSLEYINESSETYLIDFETVLHDPTRVISGLAQWLNLRPDAQAIERFSSEFISPQLSHGAEESFQALALDPLVMRAYTYWRNVTTQGQSVASALRSGEWLQIKETFERDIKPLLTSVRVFYEADRQLEVLDSRLVTMSRALETAERLALERLVRIEALDTQLKHTSYALAIAEQLAIQRLELLEQSASSHEAGSVETQLSLEVEMLAARLVASEGLAIERLQQIEHLDGELRGLRVALDRCEHLANNRLVEIQQLTAGLAASETLAVERLQQVEHLDNELRGLHDALGRCERLANSRLAEIQQLTAGLARCEELAVGRLRYVECAEREIRDLRIALDRSEQLAFSRMAEIRALDDTLKKTASALCVAEKLARERLLELEKMRLAGD